ncbi:MAG: hypothetical protein KGL01_07450 [Betaproteobacteria bacterium]|nr:hypothetical protein [Betaproteobacteria bacterium]
MANLLVTVSTACGGKAAWPQPDRPNYAGKRMYKAKGDLPVALVVAAVVG